MDVQSRHAVGPLDELQGKGTRVSSCLSLPPLYSTRVDRPVSFVVVQSTGYQSRIRPKGLVYVRRPVASRLPQRPPHHILPLKLEGRDGVRAVCATVSS